MSETDKRIVNQIESVIAMAELLNEVGGVPDSTKKNLFNTEQFAGLAYAVMYARANQHLLVRTVKEIENRAKNIARHTLGDLLNIPPEYRRLSVYDTNYTQWREIASWMIEGSRLVMVDYNLSIDTPEKAMSVIIDRLAERYDLPRERLNIR